MVKFGKHLEMEAVPEWGAAYCSYKQLKKKLKNIKLQVQLQGNRSAREDSTSLVRRLSLDSISRARRRGHQWQHTDFIRVHRRTLADGAQLFETKLLQAAEPTGYERIFFASLDEQLNKVEDFYHKKETEFLERAEMLDKQMEALHEMQTILDRANSKAAAEERNSNSFNSDSRSKEGSPRSTQEFSPRETQDAVKLNGTTYEIATAQQTVAALPTPDETPGSQLRMSIPATSARAVISALTQAFWDDLRQQLNLSASDRRGKDDSTAVSSKKMQYAAKMLRTAYIEFYRGLTLLKGYSSLNIVAFGKILKKYDKITGRHASPTYLGVVEESYMNTTDKISKLIEKVEQRFTADFTQGDRRSAMRSLRPLPQKDSHVVTFFLGVFTGSITALIAAFGILIQVGGDHWNPSPAHPSYKETEPVFQVFGMLALIVLHIYLYGWNVYLWRRARVNYGFIFEFAPGKELRYREVLLLASGLATVVIGGMVAHFASHIRVHEKDSERPPSVYLEIIPLIVVGVFLLLLFLPNKVCYYSSRKFFLRCLHHLTLAPLYKVVFADFFLGDQLTSQIQTLRSMEYFTCYYMGGFFTRQNTQTCLSSQQYRHVAYLVSSLPYFFRLMQCVRRWRDEADLAHVANGGKYCSAILAVCMRLTYTNYNTTSWLVVSVITSCIATIYGLYWDLVVDWGLLQPHSRNPWLRDQLMLRSKPVYFFCMASNTLLRLAWLLSLNQLHISSLGNPHFQDLLVAVLEVVRRGQWNFFRLENEHLNNVGKYRAVKTVPLPFREVVGADEEV